MVERSLLPEDDAKFKPLYRARCFDQLRRDIAKRVEGSTWYKGIEVYDKFRNEWKSDVKYCRERPIGREKETEKEVICAVFIPPSENSLLLKKIEEVELEISDRMDFRVKLVE